jgi:hypothetical protein
MFRGSPFKTMTAIRQFSACYRFFIKHSLYFVQFDKMKFHPRETVERGLTERKLGGAQ